jgi:hypothetical protein
LVKLGKVDASFLTHRMQMIIIPFGLGFLNFLTLDQSLDKQVGFLSYPNSRVRKRDEGKGEQVVEREGDFLGEK